jgi:hypothetical protein
MKANFINPVSLEHILTDLPYYWLETSLPAEELESRPAVKKAWEQFQIVAGLSKSTKILKDEF